MKNAPHKRTEHGLLAAAAAGTLAVVVLASPAQAGDWSFDIGLHSGPRYVQARTRHHEPAYETRTRRIWVEPLYEERIIEVEIPPVIRTRKVPVYDIYGRHAGYRRVREMIEPARIEQRVERVLIREGFYRRVTERVLITPPIHGVELQRVPVTRVARSGFHLSLGYDKHHKHRKIRVPRRHRRLNLHPARRVRFRR